jgi:hypothetical protein
MVDNHQKMSFEDKLNTCSSLFGNHNTRIDFDELNRFIIMPPSGFEPFVNKENILIDSFVLHLCIHPVIINSMASPEAYCDKIIEFYNKFANTIKKDYTEIFYNGYKIVFMVFNEKIVIKTVYEIGDNLSLIARVLRNCNNISLGSMKNINTISINRYIEHICSKNFIKEYEYIDKDIFKKYLKLNSNKYDTEYHIFNFIRNKYNFMIVKLNEDE